MSDEQWHGTSGGYTNHDCRCEGCTEAFRVEHNRYMAAHPEQRQRAAVRQQLATARRNGFTSREAYEASRPLRAVLVSCPFCPWSARAPVSWMKNGRAAGYHAHVKDAHPPRVQSV